MMRLNVAVSEASPEFLRLDLERGDTLNLALKVLALRPTMQLKCPGRVVPTENLIHVVMFEGNNADYVLPSTRKVIEC